MIRPYNKEDVEEVLETWFQATTLAHPFMESDFLKKERNNIREIYLPNTLTWVYANERGLYGFISMMGNEVGAIFVRPEKHGHGIGKALMDHVQALHPILEVEVFEKNKIGRAFYDRYGFKVIQRSLHKETGEPLLRMKFTNQSEKRSSS